MTSRIARRRAYRTEPAPVRHSDRAWPAKVQGTETHYHRVIGAAEKVLACAEEIGQQWLPGIGVARLMAERQRKPKAV